MRKIVRLSFTQAQYDLMQRLMDKKHQTNKTAFFVYLLANEEQGYNPTPKNPVGRPKKDVSTTEDVVDTNLYPAPYKGGAPYTMEQLEGYYEYRNEVMPDIPEPLTKAEIAKFN